MKEIDRKVYAAEDGEEFNTPEECQEYELRNALESLSEKYCDSVKVKTSGVDKEGKPVLVDGPPKDKTRTRMKNEFIRAATFLSKERALKVDTTVPF